MMAQVSVHAQRQLRGERIGHSEATRLVDQMRLDGCRTAEGIPFLTWDQWLFLVVHGDYGGTWSSAIARGGIVSVKRRALMSLPRLMVPPPKERVAELGQGLAARFSNVLTTSATKSP